VLLVALGLAGWATYRFRAGELIAPNVFIEGVDVAGLRPVEAQAKVLREWGGGLPAAVLLTWPDGSASLSRKDLGCRLDVDQAVRRAGMVGRTGAIWQAVLERLRGRRARADLRVTCSADTRRLREALEELSLKVDRAPRDARVRVQEDGVEVIPEKLGVKLDLDASVGTLRKALADPRLEKAEIVVRTAKPAIVADDLRGFDTVLASYATSFSSGERNRTENLQLGASLLNETVLLPGQGFSLNQRLGPRSTDRGFKHAPTIVNGELVPTPGGGVCQIATTLYNVVLLAGMRVTERHHHSRPIAYTPAGRDATISWGGADLKFRNDLKHPVLLLVTADESRMRARLLGNHEDDYEVELARSGFKSVPRQEKEVLDPTLKPGERKIEKPGRNGTQVTLARTIRRGGQVLKKEVLHTDVYAPETRIVRVGPQAPGAPWSGTGPPPPGAAPAAGANPTAGAKPTSGTRPPAKPAKPAPARPGG